MYLIRGEENKGAWMEEGPFNEGKKCKGKAQQKIMMSFGENNVLQQVECVVLRVKLLLVTEDERTDAAACLLAD